MPLLGVLFGLIVWAVCHALNDTSKIVKEKVHWSRVCPPGYADEYKYSYDKFTEFVALAERLEKQNGNEKYANRKTWSASTIAELEAAAWRQAGTYPTIYKALKERGFSGLNLVCWYCGFYACRKVWSEGKTPQIVNKHFNWERPATDSFVGTHGQYVIPSQPWNDVHYKYWQDQDKCHRMAMERMQK